MAFVFKICNLLAGVTWLVLIFTPTDSRLKAWIARGWISMGLSIVYIVGPIGWFCSRLVNPNQELL